MNQLFENTALIKKEAHALGFSHVGIARAERLTEEGLRLDQWLDRGFHAEMHWMERNTLRRQDPGEILPGAQSVVVVAWNYYTSHEHVSNPDTGKISRYAWGDDYHDVVTPLVRKLGAFLDTLDENATSRCYVDTGPVMEKAWAARAGIGWIGKHTNLITRNRGSWVFLGVIVTTLKLIFDEPALDLCGTCRACIDACPTNAISDPYVVDSNKCIPYLTIECKDDEIPSTHNMDFDHWIFGCDTCQDVCPWNRFAEPTPDSRFAPREFSKSPKLTEVLEMDDEAFRERFRRSPVKRTKLKGLQRNARIVLRQNESNSQ